MVYVHTHFSLTISLITSHIVRIHTYSHSSFVLLIGGTYFFLSFWVNQLYLYNFFFGKKKSFYSSMDLTFHFRRPFCRCFLYPVRCSRSMGCRASFFLSHHHHSLFSPHTHTIHDANPSKKKKTKYRFPFIWQRCLHLHTEQLSLELLINLVTYVTPILLAPFLFFVINIYIYK